MTDGAQWKDRMGRIGLAGRGVLYGVIAFLALQLALGSPDDEASSDGAFVWIAKHPFGKVLLVVLTIALFLLAFWRFLDAAIGDPVEGDEATDRVRFAAKGVVYLGLAIGALTTTVGSWTSGNSGGSAGGGSGGGGEAGAKKATGVVLDWPLGTWIVGAAGLGLIGYAVYMFKHHALDASFTKRLTTSANRVEAVGRAGYGARSVVWGVAGVLLVQAAVTYDPNKAGGLSTALYELATATWGPFLLAVVACGLMAFGVFCVAEARYRRAA